VKCLANQQGPPTPYRACFVNDTTSSPVAAPGYQPADQHYAVTVRHWLARWRLLVKNGGRQNDLDWAEGILQQRNERLQSNLSLERDVDVARVAADLSRAEASYQASLLVTSKLFGNNLMQYLR
jgi:plasmid replication initiation protein